MNRHDEKKLNTLSPFEVKNTLIDLAEKNTDKLMINAGRGNPNWVATTPREAFFQLGMFALTEADRSFKEYEGFGGMAEKAGIASRFFNFCYTQPQNKGIDFLVQAVIYLQDNLAIDQDALIYEWVEGILGDNYPVPDRMLINAEKIAHSYIQQEMCAGFQPPEGKFDLFAVEGGTAAMVYIFNTLKSNHLLKEGDTIALGTPIFTPYIEMPELEDYNLNTIEIMANENIAWQISDEEIEKLRDPKVKAFFLVNPSNPASVKLSSETLLKIAKIAEERPDLILLTDDVYGTFTNEFTSLAMIAPKNTILVYSYSKYFGATGWRLGVIAVHEDNIFDEMIANLPEDERQSLAKRYSDISLEPENIKFIDRLVADSRAVALNHTAGLSTPQQIQMSLFSLLSLMDTDNAYKSNAQHIVRCRYHRLMEKAPTKPFINEADANGAFYYVEIDMKPLSAQVYGEDFFNWLEANFEPLDFLIRLAEEYSVVVMPGSGFDAPTWSLRVSLANLNDDDYETIMDSTNSLLAQYHEQYLTVIGQ